MGEEGKTLFHFNKHQNQINQQPNDDDDFQFVSSDLMAVCGLCITDRGIEKSHKYVFNDQIPFNVLF